MPQIPFRKKALTRLAIFWLSTSALTAPAIAAIIGYTNGSNNTSPIVLSDNSTILQVNAGETATQSGPISDGGNGYALTVDSFFGTLIFNGQNTYGGTTTIVNSGTLQVGNGATSGQLGSGAVIVQANGVLAFNRSDTVVMANNVSGAGGVRQLGSGTLIVTGALANTGTNVTFGTMQIGNGGTTGSIAGDIQVDLFGTLIFNRSDTYVYDGNMFGLGKVIQAGTGTLVVGNVNFAQSLTINAGTVQAGTGVIGPSNSDIIVNGGTFDLNGKSKTVGALSGSGGAIILGSGHLTTNGNATTTLASAISGSGSLTKIGFGTLTLIGTNTYFGGTTITAGGLRVGNGGTSGSIVGNITNNGSLIFNRSDTVTFAGRIDGNGTFQQAGTGTLILTGSSQNFAGTTTISAGTLQIGDGSAGPYLAGNLVNNSILAFNVFGPMPVGAISGTGSVQQIGISTTTTLVGANTYTGGTVVNGGTLQLGAGGSLAPTGALTVNGGTFDLNGHNQTVGALSGGGGLIALTNGTLTTNTASNMVLASQFTSIVNAGSFVKAGAGKLTLIGDSITGAGTTIAAGTLEIGNGGTAGTLAGNITNNAALIFNRSNAVSFASVISGSGTLTKLGASSLTFSGSNTYTGATTVSAGTLNVTGSIASSSVTVASGATLNGTGTVGATTIQNGGTLAPGNSIGTLTVNGNLTLASGSIYIVEVSPTAADRTNVSGAASLNGTVAASVASGTYSFGQRFTILTATNGVSGNFSLLTGIPISLKGQLGYDANNAYLTLSPNALAPLLSNATGNQHNVAAAIDAAVTAGSVPPAGFVALYSLSGPALNSALDQISGQAAPNVSNAVGQGFLNFLSMTAGGGSGDTGNFAPGSAYGGADAPHRAQLGTGEARIWGAVYGGHVGLSGDSVSGAAGLSSNNVGLIGGADMRLADGFLAGVTLGLGRQQFHSGNGSGDSDDYSIGVYGRADAGAAYVTASLAYGRHQIRTQRVVTVSGTDLLQGKQDADDIGGRIEAGWRVPLGDAYTIIPYGAFAGDSFESPAYGETALSGASTFALSYAAQTTTLGRSELGAHLDRRYALDTGMLTADVRAGWAHQLDDLPFTQAGFINLPGAAFQVAGVRPARDAALLGLDLEVQNNSGLFFGLKGEGQFGAGTTVAEGMGNFGWRW